MKHDEITLETSTENIIIAIERGEMTMSDWRLAAKRLRQERELRLQGANRAILAVQLSELRKRPRTAKWTSKYAAADDGSCFYLVRCGRASWRVRAEPVQYTVKKVH